MEHKVASVHDWLNKKMTICSISWTFDQYTSALPSWITVATNNEFKAST